MHNYYLRKAVNLYLKVSKEDDETMASEGSSSPL